MTSTATRSLVVALALGACTGADESYDVGDTNAPVLAYPSNRGTIDYSGSVTGMYYGDAPIMTGTTNLYMIFYGPGWTVPQISALLDFGHGLGGSPIANILTSYTDSTGARASSAFDLVDYTTVTSYTRGRNLTDNAIAMIVNDAVAQALPEDPNGMYIVFSDAGAGTTSSGSCICGHHFQSGNGHVIAQLDDPRWCQGVNPSDSFCAFPTPVSPNGDTSVDEIAMVAWHEIAEAVTDPVTDPVKGGWRTRWVPGTSNSGETELADMCGKAMRFNDSSHPAVANLQLDRVYNAPNGGIANVRLDARDWLLPTMWQNADRGGCVMRLGFSRPAWSADYPAGDLDGNGIADLIWRSAGDGTVRGWLLDSSNGVITTGTIRSALPESWQIYGLGRFNNDKNSDVVIRNVQTGQIRIWLMNGLSITTSVDLVTPPGDELLKGIGDFNGDGYADLLFQDMTDNSIRVWYNNAITNGGVPKAFDFSTLAPFPKGPSQSDNSEVVGTGDFDGDGWSEVLLYNLDTQTYRTWSFSGLTVKSKALDLQAAGCERVMGIADMNVDGTADLVCESKSATEVGWVKMLAGAPAALIILADMPDNEWRFTGASRFGLKPQTGLLWRNRMTGDLSRWLISTDGKSVSSHHIAVGTSLSWEAISY